MSAKQKMLALGRLKAGQMNKTEQAYADYLEQRKRMGEVLWYKFEGIKLRLADNTFYTPDFAVMGVGGELSMHEVKGFWQDDAKVKIKARAKKNGGGWDVEEF